MGLPGGGPALKTYNFDDLIAALNHVAPYDWGGFLKARLERTGKSAPLGGIENAGWHLIYTETPNLFTSEPEDGAVSRFQILYRSAAGWRWRCCGFGGRHGRECGGHEPGMKITAVNGKQWSPDALREALRASKTNASPIELTVNNDGYIDAAKLDYHGGERYPHLQRDETKPDLLSQIAAPHANASPLRGLVSIPDLSPDR